MGEAFQEVLDKAAIAVVTDLNGTIISVNDNFCRVSKYHREDLVGENTGILKSDSHPESFYQEIRRATSAGKTWVGQIKNRAKDGSIYWVQTTVVPILNSEGAQVQYLSFGIDITETKKMEMEAKKNNDLFSVIAGTGSWELDMETGEVVFSPNAMSLLGIEDPGYKSSLEGIVERIHPDDRQEFRKEIDLFVTENKPFNWEFRIIKPNGEIRLMQTSSIVYKTDEGRVFSMVGMIKDITDKNERERELVENKEILENIADNIPGMVMRYAEYAAGRREILYVSKGVEQLLEISQEEVVLDADSIAMRIHKDDLKGFYESIAESRHKLSIWDIEKRIVMEDGRVKWINFTGMPKKNREGTIIWNVLVLDISDRRKAEELIEKNMEMLSFQNKQLLDFCNIVSHNLRSPLINLSMLIDLIEESQAEEEKRGFLESMKPVIENLNETFEELVESIQIRQDVEIISEKIVIEEYYKKMINGFGGQLLETGARIETDFSNASEVFFPPKYFSSILHNLVSNALKYHAVDRTPEINLFTKRKENGNVLLVVQDNGLGIDLTKHGNNLFKMRKVFHRHPDAKGFGLFITKTQVESMGGKIWAESEPDKGSSFFVEFRNRER